MEPMSEADSFPQQFKDKGAAAVRTMLSSGMIAPSFQRACIAWLAEQDDLEARARDNLEREQADIARSTKDATWESAKAAQRSADAAEHANRIAWLALAVSIFAALLAAVAVYRTFIHLGS